MEKWSKNDLRKINRKWLVFIKDRKAWNDNLQKTKIYVGL